MSLSLGLTKGFDILSFMTEYNALEVNFGRASYETVSAGKREYMPSMFQ